MIFAHLRVAAALASVSSAFLLPPQISKADKDVANTLPFTDVVTMDGRVVGIECPHCPFSDISGTTHYLRSSSTLVMNFTVSHHNSESDKLLLNGLPIYPVDLRQTMNGEVLTADQIFEAPNNVRLVTKLGYSMSTNHLENSGQDQISLTTLHINVVQVAGRFISSVPSMDVKLLETPSGKLMIGEIEVIAGPYTAGQECTSSLCEWKAIIAAKVSEFKKGCGNSIAHSQISNNRGPRVGKHRGHRHHKPSAFARLLHGIFLHVFIPVVIGIMVGIFASLIGMIVGHLAIFAWRLVFRRGRNNECVRLRRVGPTEDKNIEVKPFIEALALPPKYEEAANIEKV